MAKPVIKTIRPFDGNKEIVIPFTYTGNQPYKNKAVIYDANTLDVVYENTVNVMKLEHAIPANTLTNGKQYAITIQCFDNQSNPSVVSEKTFFWCFTTPIFKFSGVDDGNTIKTSSFVAEMLYEQPEEEPLAQTRYYIYNATKELLNVTDIVYGEEPKYTYNGFVNQTNYYIRAEGQTTHGMNVDTGLIRIFVKFENPGTYAMIYANQDVSNNGTVNYWTNITIIRPDRDDYEVKDGKLDIRGDYITYDQGFSINDDFTLAIKHTYVNGELLDMKNLNDDHIKLYMIDDRHGCRYMLKVNDSYTIFSDFIDGFDDNIDNLTVYIRCKNHAYDIYLFYQLNYLLKDYKIWLNGDEPNADRLNVWEDTGIFNGYVTDADIKVVDTEPSGVPNNTIWIGGAD